MKKTFQSLSALALTFVMLLALAVPAFAAGTYKITINSSTAGHTYEAYQIFAGDLSGTEGSYVLSNITWGSGVNGTELLAALRGDASLGSIFGSATSAADVAQAMDNIGDDSDTAKAFAAVVGQHLAAVAGTSTPGTDSYTITGLDAGYYLVKDKNDSQNGENYAYTRFILEVVGDVTAAPKTGIPTVTKKVKENVKFGAEYNDVADYNIGDQIPFKLTGTLPSNYGDYASYQYIFHDTLSAGLTYNGDAKVYVEGTLVTSGFDVAFSAPALTITFANLKSIGGATAAAGSTITVEYTATLNASAVIGQTGNTNAVYLEYSNNPNPGGGGNTGETPVDKVVVFTYELDVTKVDGAETTKFLGGAEFKLTNADGKYAQVDANGKLTGWANEDDPNTTLTSDAATGLFKVIGLDDGTYFLTEVKAPTGYNKLESAIQVVITAGTVHNTEWISDNTSDALRTLTVAVDSGEAKDGVLSTGTVAITIANNKGATLPSTGGVGTTIFYAVGGVLMLGAVVLLITKKRIGGK